MDLFTDLYWRLLAVVDTPAWSVGKEWFVDLKFISDVWQKTWEILQKTWEIFRKTWEFFCEKFGANGREVVSIAGAGAKVPKPV